MSMAAIQAVDLSRSSPSERIVRSWDAKTGTEKILIMMCVAFSIAILGFVTGTAALKATERNYDNQISSLDKQIEDCLAQNNGTSTTYPSTSPTTSFSTNSTTDSSPASADEESLNYEDYS